jgi:hypothetical protein
MTMHIEQGAIRSAYPLFGNFSAVMRAKFKAWRAQRIERAQIEALAGLDPGILDDIGISVVNADKPFLPVLNPYGIVADALFAPRKRNVSSEF